MSQLKAINKKTVLSSETQKLLEQIFDFFGGKKEARKDPDLCLKKMLMEIHKDIYKSPITATLQDTLQYACKPGAIQNFREKLAEKSKRRKVMA